MKYTLYKSQLPAANGAYHGRIHHQGTIDLLHLAKQIAEGGSTVTESDLVASLLEIVKVIKIYLSLGYNIEFGTLCNFKPRMSGTFTNEGDVFDHLRHKVYAGAVMHKDIKDKLNVQTMEKLDRLNTNPVIHTYLDSGTGLENDTFTGGQAGSISGRRLRFDGNAIDEGVFMVDSLDPSEAVRITSILENNPGKVIFTVPTTPLTSGEGFLELRSRLGDPAGNVAINRLADKMTSA